MKSTASLSVALLLAGAAFAQGPTVTFTSFGRPCGGDLTAQAIRGTAGIAIRFDVANAAPGSVAVLAVGHQARPQALPGSDCLLLVDPRGLFFSQVDRAGAAAFRFPLPPIVPLSADIQVVTVGLNRSGRTAESTNGVNLSVQ